MNDLERVNDDTGSSKHPVTRPKARDFIRLSSESTRESPRMLGGTLKDAQDYLDKLSPEERQAYNDFNAYRQWLQPEGKNKIDDTGPSKLSVTRPKSRDFIRLSSESTPENPRMLGGTSEEANVYINKLSHTDRQAYNDYNACLRRLQRTKTPNPTYIAKHVYPDGYKIFSEYHRIYKKKAEQSKNQPGESSTTNRFYTR